MNIFHLYEVSKVTQMKEALRGNITDEIKSVAETEGIDVHKIIKGLANGRIVIPKNINGKSRPVGIGKCLKTKINANIGSSSELEKVEWEVEKAKVAVKYGADTIMDLSTGPEYERVLKAIMETVNVPIGTVPIYEAGITASNTKGAVVNTVSYTHLFHFLLLPILMSYFYL